MRMKFSIFGLTLAAMMAASAQSIDSVKVVKGQVSDYYIPVVEQRTIEGFVTDAHGKKLQGATVMFLYSPIHCNTDADGRFALIGTDSDSLLYVYYPDMDFKTETVASGNQHDLAVVMAAESPRPFIRREPAEATRWYNPAAPTTNTYCNPVNINYNFEPDNANVRSNGSFRSSADPMGLAYGDEYFLFSTNQNGFHYSKNLSDWDFASASFKRRPTDDDQCAPAAYVSGDTLFYTGSTYEGCPIWYTTAPKSGRFRRAVERSTLPSWDPSLFLDDDGKLYLYYGSSNEYPLKAVQISRNDFRPISKIYDLLMLKPDEHGWERFGMNNDDEFTLKPFTEGAYMTKHNGRYYLQYGAPGTEFKIYADGVYVSDSPLGPFTYQKHNPMSYKPGGFVQGSGHGGTFVDNKGHYWHLSTCMLSLKYKFERRIGLYPVAFDKDGIMYSSAAFGDYPNRNADFDIANPADRFTGWMLLSFHKPVSVSSSADGMSSSAISDENIRTYWAARSADPGEWAMIDLGPNRTVRAIQLNYYEYLANQTDRADDIYHQYRIYASDNATDWNLVVDKSDNDRDCPHDYVELLEPLVTRYLKVENVHMASGNFCLSDIRVFGSAEGQAPQRVKGFRVVRDSKDPRNAMISWQHSDGAYGYNIYYGIAPDKMYNAITVNGDNRYDMRGLDIDTEYFFAIEALGETGRSSMSDTVRQ